MRQRDLIPVPWALGGLRGQSTFNLERGVVVLKEQASLNVAFASIISVLLKVFYSPGCRAEAGLKLRILSCFHYPRAA